MTPDEYLGRVQATVWRAAEYVPAGRLDEVYRLINHGEPAEGLCSLAWVIVNTKSPVPGEVIEAIYEYTAELVDDEFLPPKLKDFAAFQAP